MPFFISYLHNISFPIQVHSNVQSLYAMNKFEVDSFKRMHDLHYGRYFINCRLLGLTIQVQGMPLLYE